MGFKLNVLLQVWGIQKNIDQLITFDTDLKTVGFQIILKGGSRVGFRVAQIKNSGASLTFELQFEPPKIIKHTDHT